MEAFTNQQLQSAIAQLDQALSSHEQWYKGVLRVLVLHVSPDESDLLSDAHRRCRFGQWLDSPDAAFLHNHSTCASLGVAHEKMHIDARTLLLKVSNDQEVLAGDFDQFNITLDRMRLEIQSLRQELADLAQNRDPLTGARNRFNLLTTLREQLALVQRGVQRCAIVMLDLDHFKRVNDEYGHTAGDSVLVATVRCLQAHARPYDRIYRYGGEEFILCMPGVTLEQACDGADRLCKAIAALRIPVNSSGQLVQVTASFGVAELNASRPVEDSIDRVDKAMYKAKALGRNRVVAED